MIDTACINTVKPVLKWAGGKTQLLGQLTFLMPTEEITTYCKPFLGDGAMLFSIQPGIAYVNDINVGLMNVYNIIKYFPEELIAELNSYENTAKFYYVIRELDRDAKKFAALTAVEQAARFIYLNKTCFNGLHRENRQGQFNVSYGKYKSPDFVNAEGIRAVSQYLNAANIYFTSMDFLEVLKNIPAGSFVYFDPPYDPVSETANFTGYTRYGFTSDDHIRLKQCCDELTAREIKFMLSNSNTDFIRQLYAGYHITEVSARRAINCNGDGRGVVTELVIRNYS
ncbi:MAG: DNA adenine methylase [Ruminococcus sp.]|nr:DNA adenine methylase [Ruminococcus sp.]